MPTRETISVFPYFYFSYSSTDFILLLLLQKFKENINNLANISYFFFFLIFIELNIGILCIVALQYYLLEINILKIYTYLYSFGPQGNIDFMRYVWYAFRVLLGNSSLHLLNFKICLCMQCTICSIIVDSFLINILNEY